MKFIIKILAATIYFFSCTNALEAQVDTTKMVNLPYRLVTPNYNVGNINVIDALKEYQRDSRSSISSALEGKISGSLGGLSLNGLGDAYTVVDGIATTIEYLNLREVEQIVVLKDAVSRLLYGVETDVPIVLITTKKGLKNKKIVEFNTEYGLLQSLGYPKLLDAASYMETYNTAYRNDGATTDFYASDIIQKTRSGADPILYPSNNYYSPEYVKDVSNFSRVFGTFSGGNDKVQYVLNLDWTNNQGWNQLKNTLNNKFNIRTRIDFEVNKWLKMNTQVVASYNLTDAPTMTNFWAQANTLLPNAFPELIPTSRINNLDSLPNYFTMNGGNLLGGTSIYQNNMHGDLLRSGTSSEMRRYIQSRVGFDLDLSPVSLGLSAHGAISYDYFNVYKQVISNSYSVYEVGALDANSNFRVSQIGLDKVTSQQNVNKDDMNFNRSTKWNFSLNYDRRFGQHSISAIAMSYGSRYTQLEQSQSPRKLAFGGQLSYIFADKYLLDLSLLSQASLKVKPTEQFGFSKSIGAAWIVSNEDFFAKDKVLNFCKLRASYGHFVSDAFTQGLYGGYFLNENLYSSLANYNYNNGLNSNTKVFIANLNNQIGWEKRNELSVGTDVSLLKNKLWLDATYINSYSYDNVTLMDVLKPLVAGGVSSYSNYNASNYEAVNIGLKWNEKLGDVQIDLGLFYTFSYATIRKIAENFYNEPTNKHLSKVNTDASALWALTSERLYTPSDFDALGNLNPTLPTTTWGKVKPGDIKYVDYNNDGMINDNDLSIVGRNKNNSQIALNIGLKYKQWEFFVLPMAQFGGNGFKNSNYYWFKGNSAKFSEIALGAFDVNNPDAAATYPRLSLGGSTNNYRNSTYWMYDKSYFQLVAAQLSYNILFRKNQILKKINIFVKGSNLFTIAKDKTVLELNYGTAPQSRIISLGTTFAF